jgi:hypothetical protein
MTGSMPSVLKVETASLASGFGESNKAIIPTTAVSTVSITVVLPSPCYLSNISVKLFKSIF